jgi:peptide deformylase
MKPTSKSVIVQRDAPVLREMAKEVPLADIPSKKIQDLIKEMKAALHAEEDGVAIAAPQIGASLRIFVVNGETIAYIERKKHAKENEDEELEEPQKKLPPTDDIVYINPEITKFSKKKKKMEEGCLSVRWLYGQVERSEKVTLVAHNEHGKKVTHGVSGLMAQIFQHEVDHLNGILFTDMATDVEDLPPEHTDHAA